VPPNGTYIRQGGHITLGIGPHFSYHLFCNMAAVHHTVFVTRVFEPPKRALVVFVFAQNWIVIDAAVSIIHRYFTTPNVAAIGLTITQISRFFDFQNGGCQTSCIVKNLFQKK